jgi:hypothetical protein
VVVVGHPLVYPLIDASKAIRAFKVLPGGFLEIKFVRIRQGMDVMRDRYSLDTGRRRKRGLQRVS